ncbi:MAG: peptidase C1 [bacterium]|nr:peptidase C1 [bacterium]
MALRILAVLTVILLFAGSALADEPVYRAKNKYPVLDEIKAARQVGIDARDSVRAAVEAEWDDRQQAVKDAKLALRVDWSKIERPESPESFLRQLWHTPPTPQYYTGTCWAFCSLSFVESEAHRITGVEAKLSEMWIVYWEYVEKAMSRLASYGHTPVAQGGQDHGTFEVIRKYGIVPRASYAGVFDADGRHDHALLNKELNAYLTFVLDNGMVDIEESRRAVRAILDKHMGTPPEDVQWEGKTYSPQTFASKILGIVPDDYVACVSRMNAPFYADVLLDVEDNWRRKTDYLNLPLTDFYEVIKKAVQDGYTVAIGGDNSEPGMDGQFDTAVIPDWDLPAKAINQGSREHRIVNGETGDDHGVHVVAWQKKGGQDWFLIKDSNRSSRLGQYEGYYFWSGDYIRLKMLSFTIHKDRLEGLGG